MNLAQVTIVERLALLYNRRVFEIFQTIRVPYLPMAVYMLATFSNN